MDYLFTGCAVALGLLLAVWGERNRRQAEVYKKRDSHNKVVHKALEDTFLVVQTALRDVTDLLSKEVPNTQVLRQSAEVLLAAGVKAESLTQEIQGRGASLSGHAASLNQHVSDAVTALEETTFSSNEVARNIGELSQSCKETAAAMTAIDKSIGDVEANATETSRLTAKVSADAEQGVAALAQTILGIDKIRDTGRLASEVIGSLGQKIGEVGHILNVIDDVAEQTNLLALNAAIIAAQAGEHGRGFAVVADEIKALAERTGSSTKEIAELIQTVQSQSLRATDVMAQGSKTMDDGVTLGQNAQAALHNIVDSAKRSLAMMQLIAAATVEQAKGSRQVTDSVGHIANTVQQLFFATAEQARGSAHIAASAAQIRALVAAIGDDVAHEGRMGHTMQEDVIAQLRAVGRGMEQQFASRIEHHAQVMAAVSRTPTHPTSDP